MKARNVSAAFAVTVLGIALLPANAAAQQKALKEQLVGTWTFVSSTGKLPDGSPTWGANPKGQLIFAENGRFSVQIMRSDRPNYAANSRLKGTAEENKATAEGTISYFGTFAISDADKTINYQVEGSSYPNWTGTTLKRHILSVTDDELKYANPAPSAGGAPTELVWKRAK
jgi:hypothetical protein